MSLTVLQVFNKALGKTGLIGTDLTDLSSLSNDKKRVWRLFEEVWAELAQFTLWSPLREEKQLTLVSGTDTYAEPDGLIDVDPVSFICNNRRRVDYVTPQDVEEFRVDRTRSGEPLLIWREAGNLKVFPVPNSAANGKIISYRDFELPDDLDVAAPNVEVWVPQKFDETVLVNWLVMRDFETREREQALIYKRMLFGDGNRLIGSLDKMKERLEDPCVSAMREGYDVGRGVRSNVGGATHDYGRGPA